jgi:uncharacterized protein
MASTTTSDSSGFGPLRKGVFPAIMKDPHASAWTQPFWDAAQRNQLLGAKCVNCGTFRLPPAPFCFNCQTQDIEWVELAGTGRIFSFTVVRHPLSPELSDCVPYVAGVVEIDGTQGAGARMISNIIDCDVETVKIGDAVEIAFEQVNEAMSAIRFRPRKT